MSPTCSQVDAQTSPSHSFPVTLLALCRGVGSSLGDHEGHGDTHLSRSL